MSLSKDFVKTLGELKTGDTFYLINWRGDHISSIESKVVDSILDIKIGRIICYNTDNKNKTGLGLTLKTNELNENVIDYHYQMQVCSDKNVLYEIIENDKEEFMYNYQQMLLIKQAQSSQSKEKQYKLRNEITNSILLNQKMNHLFC